MARIEFINGSIEKPELTYIFETWCACSSGILSLIILFRPVPFVLQD